MIKLNSKKLIKFIKKIRKAEKSSGFILKNTKDELINLNYIRKKIVAKEIFQAIYFLLII